MTGYHLAVCHIKRDSVQQGVEFHPDPCAKYHNTPHETITSRVAFVIETLAEHIHGNITHCPLSSAHLSSHLLSSPPVSTLPPPVLRCFIVNYYSS